MDSEIERTIIHYYPQRALVSPLQSDSIVWDYDPEYSTLKRVIAELQGLDPSLGPSAVVPGTRGRYDLGEELILCGSIRLQLSYLGPFAASCFQLGRELDEGERELERKAIAILGRHGIRVLPPEVLAEPVPWIQHGGPADVWSCLFVLPEVENLRPGGGAR